MINHVRGNSHMTVFCFGDSNTYGYDPRSYAGERYSVDVRWTGLLSKATGWRILEAGQNGREIPHRHAELDALTRLPQADVFVIMLGSNDLLMHPVFRAEDVAARLEVCLTVLQEHFPTAKILVVAPVPMVSGTWVAEERLIQESARLALCYRELCTHMGVHFTDAGKWDVELLFDGVHFSEAGHLAFAKGLQKALE